VGVRHHRPLRLRRDRRATASPPISCSATPSARSTIDDQTDPITFVSVPVTPDIIVAAGNLDIDAYVIVAAASRRAASRPSTPDPMAQLATVTAEGEAVSLLAGPGPLPDPLQVDGTLVCELSTDVTIVLKPTLVMEILGQKFEIADIEIPIELPPFADILRLGPVAMSFPRPPPPPEPETGTSDGDSHGYSSSDSDSDPGDSETPTSGDEPTTDPTTTNTSTDADDPGADDDGGCDCRSAAPSPLALLLLLALPRRRRHTLAACAPGPRSSSRP
jgi:MYXO-CTERM domain-containing protein